MDEQQTSTPKKSNNGPLIGIIGIIVIVVVGIVIAQGLNKPKTAVESATTAVQQTNTQPTQETVMQPSTAPSTAGSVSEYKDGKYSAVGNYTSPGGAEELGVTLTITKGIVTDSEVEVKATRPMSKMKQTDFSEHYKPQVIGKNIDEISLTKVSGSSLSPKGFNDAVEKIKTEAKA
jgi:hypothetical protein